MGALRTFTFLLVACNGSSYTPVIPPTVPCAEPDGSTLDASSDAMADASADFSSPVCRPPPARCTGSHDLAYFTKGTCVDGMCVWTLRSFSCAQGCAEYTIGRGACQSRESTPPAPQPPGYPY